MANGIFKFGSSPKNGNIIQSSDVHTLPRSGGRASHDFSFDPALQALQFSQAAIQDRLDREASDRLAGYKQALSEAAEEHRAVRRAAARASAAAELEHKRVRELEALDETAAADSRRIKEVETEIAQRRAELDATRKAAAAKQVEEEARLRKQQADEEAELEQRRRASAAAAASAEEDRRRQQAKVEEQRERQGSILRTDAQADQGSTQASIPSSSVSDQHGPYLALHQRLKDFRRSFTAHLKSNPPLKSKIGDMRRQIKKSVGQLTMDPSANMVPLKNLRATLVASKTLPTAGNLNFAEFVVARQLPQESIEPIPSTFVYLVNIFAKAIVAQFVSEAGVAPRAADPIGIAAITVFANVELKWHGVMLVDILLAKYHAACPVLFGARGSESTEQGRRALGWAKDRETGQWLSEQRHAERQTGLGAGFAALTLRDFKNASSTKNPLPAQNYWRAMARIANLPSRQLTSTHLMVLRALIAGHAGKVIGFFGQAGVALLRAVIVDIPARVDGNIGAGLAALRQTLAKESRLFL